MAGFAQAKTQAPLPDPYKKPDNPLGPGENGFGFQALNVPQFDPQQANHPFLRSGGLAASLAALGALAGVATGGNVGALAGLGALGGAIGGVGLNQNKIKTNQAAQHQYINSATANNSAYDTRLKDLESQDDAYRRTQVGDDPDYPIANYHMQPTWESAMAQSKLYRDSADKASGVLDNASTRGKVWDQIGNPPSATAPFQVPTPTNLSASPPSQNTGSLPPMAQPQAAPGPGWPMLEQNPGQGMMNPNAQQGQVSASPPATPHPWATATANGAERWDPKTVIEAANTANNQKKLPSEIFQAASQGRASGAKAGLDEALTPGAAALQDSERRRNDREPAPRAASAGDIRNEQIKNIRQLFENGQITDEQRAASEINPNYLGNFPIAKPGTYTKSKTVTTPSGRTVIIPPTKPAKYVAPKASKGSAAPSDEWTAQ